MNGMELTYPCDLCDARFDTADELAKHEKAHLHPS